ncbi:MAG: DUF6798 domain-containing protein [Tepidisphaeraceae bacterium]
MPRVRLQNGADMAVSVSPAIANDAPVALLRDEDGAAARPDLLAVAFAILFGVTMSLCVEGYQFGRSNHTVYLLDALRRTQPELLANDWFTTQTLQYHAVFGWMTSTLYRLGIVEPAFLVGYLALATMFHVAWYLLVRCIGGGQMTYLISVLLFYLSAGGFGLGMYQFLQDGSFLPSNVANVALLWAIVLWLRGAYGWSGAMIGLAGLFHLNHAVVGVGLWCAMVLWELWRPTKSFSLSPVLRGEGGGERPAARAGERRSISSATDPSPLPSPRSTGKREIRWAIGSALAIVPCAINIAFALRSKMASSDAMPLADFVELYVRLRHPHHYDPSSWPPALWICFLWPIPLAIWAMRRPSPARVAAARFFLLFCALLVVALLGAGVFYVSESLVQMSLYRFSIFPKLLSCVAVAWLVCDSGRVPRMTARIIAIGVPIVLLLALAAAHFVVGEPARAVLWRKPGPIVLLVALCGALALYEIVRNRWAVVHPIGIAALLAVLVAGWGRWTGFDFGYATPQMPGHDVLCAWVREPANTPVGATFLVSPSDEMFRLHAQRAIIVNFKGVPQLSGELATWRRRVCDVLDLPTLKNLPRPFNVAVAEMEKRYESMPPEHLERTAEQYGARYIVTRHRLGPEWERRAVFGAGEYVLYDRGGNRDEGGRMKDEK